MKWKPSEEERKYIELIVSMSIDCLMNNGTVDVKTYILNLKIIAGSGGIGKHKEYHAAVERDRAVNHWLSPLGSSPGLSVT